MIEIGHLSEFNISRKRSLSDCNDSEIISAVSSNLEKFPKVFLLLTETTRFYTEGFDGLLQRVKREKRLVVFETPSRVSMTHEYTVEGVNNLSQGFYFLFNALERLSWLKITLEGNRISIASKGVVLSKLEDYLGKELEELAHYLRVDNKTAALRLYNVSDGKPCFVEFNQKEQKGQQSLLFCVTFFDSIRNRTKKNNARWWSPLQEKEITYNYSTISGYANAWIYFKAPPNFVLSTKHNALEGDYEASQSNDDEITSLVLTPDGSKLSVDFTISINVPAALSFWYNGMLLLAVVITILGGVLLVCTLNKTVSYHRIEVYSNCGFAIIAALIATRGWLMSEEQVMKRMSNVYTILVGIIIIIIMMLSFLSPEVCTECNLAGFWLWWE